jgi:hypothetical protein
LMALLCGSDSDTLRLIPEGDQLIKLMACCQYLTKESEGEGPIKSFKFEIKVRGLEKDFIEYIDLLKPLIEKWSIKNVNYKNTAFNTLSFLRKLGDSGFVGSLVNESTTRRLSRCYFMRSGDSVRTNFGLMKLSDVLDTIRLFQGYNQGNRTISDVMENLIEGFDVKSTEVEIDRMSHNLIPMLQVLKRTLQSPLKICSFMSQLSMEGRSFNPVFRTLKPTQVQLVKTAQVFSSNFDPACLASYVVEPELRWALPDTRGILTALNDLNSFCAKMDIDVDSLDPDVMLKICRVYGDESTKSIYLYSRVPTDLRQIKSYSAFLTFLSVNTFDDKEINGLVLKLKTKDVGREYLDTSVNTEVYTVNNIVSLISVLSQKDETEFVNLLTIKPLTDIEWVGGKVPEFILHVKNWFSIDLHYCFLKPQILFLERKLGISNSTGLELDGGAFYTFTKRQRVRGGWYGRGEICICIDKSFYLLSLYNSTIEAVTTNSVGKMQSHHMDFIRDVCEKVNINYKSFMMDKRKSTGSLKPKLLMGFDQNGNLGVYSYREVDNGLPVNSRLNSGTFIDNLDIYHFSEMYNDTIILKTGFEGEYTYRKIYFLPVKRSELISLIPRILIEEEFKQKLLTKGLSTFEEFILTEILTEYGSDLYVDFNKFIDNYQSSKSYQIFKKCQDDNISEIPKRKTSSILPAQSGSLVRILIDYTVATRENIMKIQNRLDPTIMRLRSEYPEQMSIILSEKLIEYHEQIYSAEERKEISDHYFNISEGQNIDEVRSSIIKLMTYWGYGSLVHSIINFNLVRENKNYIYFNCSLLSKDYAIHYEPVFKHLVRSLNKVMSKWGAHYTSLDVPVKLVQLRGDMNSIISNMLLSLCLELYSFRTPFISINLDYMRYLNVLIALMQEEDFVAELQQEISKNYILSSIVVNYQNRKSFVIMFNTLLFCWSRQNKVNFELDYSLKLQRLPDSVQS